MSRGGGAYQAEVEVLDVALDVGFPLGEIVGEHSPGGQWRALTSFG